MRIFLNVLGVLAVAVGGIWALQGFDILKQSVMSGHRRWVAIGVVLVVVGIVVVVLANRRGKGSGSH